SALISKDGEFFAFSDGAIFIWQPFYEPYGGDNYFQGPEIKQDAPAGHYVVEVFGPEYNGKYVLAVGEQEKFALKEIVGTYKTLYHLKKDFFGQPGWMILFNRISLFVFGPVILTVFLLAVMGIIIYKYKSKRYNMSLIKCSECQSEMSDKALACPKCGHPNKLKKGQIDGLEMIRQDSKKWKLVKLISGLIFVVAMVGFFLRAMKTGLNDPYVEVWAGAMGLGFAGFLFGRLGAWWNRL
ncbi:MAG: zinc ribbon domain-containing protein, partial [Patescibacteria group bacterium]